MVRRSRELSASALTGHRYDVGVSYARDNSTTIHRSRPHQLQLDLPVYKKQRPKTLESTSDTCIQTCLRGINNVPLFPRGSDSLAQPLHR